MTTRDDATEHQGPTPRTDAVAPHLNLSHQDMRDAAWNLRKLAHQLERELAEITREVIKYREDEADRDYRADQRAAVSETGDNGLLRQLVLDCQNDLATYIVPDSGISEHDVVNTLLGRLDGPQSRAALAAPSATRRSASEIALRELLLLHADFDDGEGNKDSAVLRGRLSVIRGILRGQ